MRALVLPSYLQDDEHLQSPVAGRSETLLGRVLAKLVRLEARDPSVDWAVQGRAAGAGIRGEQAWSRKRGIDAAEFDLLIVPVTGETTPQCAGVCGRGQASYVEAFLLARKPVLAYVAATDKFVPIRAAVATGEDDYTSRYAYLLPA